MGVTESKVGISGVVMRLFLSFLELAKFLIQHEKSANFD